MKTISSVLAILSCALMTLLSAHAAAYLKFTYQSADMMYMGEQTAYTPDDYSPSSFFEQEAFQWEVTFVVPDFEVGISNYFTVENPVVSVTTSNFFESFTIDSSSVTFELWPLPPEEDFFSSWNLTFAITEQDSPNIGATRHGIFSASGGLHPDTLGQSTFTLHQDNWIWTHHNIDWEFDSIVEYWGEGNYTTIEKMSVPEPVAPLLLLSGLTFITVARRARNQGIKST